MDDKDKPFSFGNVKLGIIDGDGFKELPIVENSLLVATDEVDVREMTKVEPIDVERFTAGSYSVNIDNPDITQFGKLFGAQIHSQIDNAMRSSVIIETEPKINKPKNLKYPNKRRKMRIWKKWKRRFGYTPSKQVVIPRAVISFKPKFKNNQLFNTVEIVAEKLPE